MTLHLLRLQPNPKDLAVWAERHHLLSSDSDYGYAFHALLSAAFGALAPKPFRYFGGQQGLLAYSQADLAELRLNASLAAPDVAKALNLGNSSEEQWDARAFPTQFKSGQRLWFDVRVRPIIRLNHGAEKDIYQQTMEGLSKQYKQHNEHKQKSETEEPITNAPSRSEVYQDWLKKQLEHDKAAKLMTMNLEAFRLTRVLRKQSATDNGQRKSVQKSGPDAVCQGILEVNDPEIFAHLLCRGIGRHRAFGFGMLLLKPVP